MKNLVSIAFALLFAAIATAQEPEDIRANHFSVGFQLNEFQQDFGLGLQLTSPYFANGHLAFRLRGNWMYLQHLGTEGETTWTGYPNALLGIVSNNLYAGKQMRLYGEGGAGLLLPGGNFSGQEYELAGYGLFGFEFFFAPAGHAPGSYFIEAGGIGTGAVADEVAGKPIYSNGFMLSTGFRWYF